MERIRVSYIVRQIGDCLLNEKEGKCSQDNNERRKLSKLTLNEHQTLIALPNRIK